MRKRLSMQRRFHLACMVRSGAPFEEVATSFSVGLPYVRRAARDLVPFLELLDRSEFYVGRGGVPSRPAATVTREQYSELNAISLQVYRRLAAARHVLSETKLKMVGLAVARRLGLGNFKASNGWLERFKKRNSIGPSRVRCLRKKGNLGGFIQESKN
ncbi:hypothetical protein MHBO_002253, partial [Bonamia ostreae]